MWSVGLKTKNKYINKMKYFFGKSLVWLLQLLHLPRDVFKPQTPFLSFCKITGK